MPPSRRGTGYTNLQTYLGLNQGIATQMGNGIAQDVETAGQEVEDASLEALRKHDVNVQSGVRNRPASVDGLTAEQAETGAVQGYGGPTSFTLGPMYGKAATAQNSANALMSNTGRATLLGKKSGENTWGGGQLDAALAGTGGAGQRLRAAQGSYGRLLSTLQGREQAGQGIIDTAQRTSADTQRWYKDQLPGLQQKEAEAQKARDRADAGAAAERDATEAAGGDGSYRPGGYARPRADENRSRGVAPVRGVGGGRRDDAEARRIGGGIHRNLGGWL